MRTKLLIALAGSACLFVSTDAQAQSSDPNCDKALISTVYTEATSLHDDWRLSVLVTKEVWESASQHADASATLYDVPIGGSYDDYHSRSEKTYMEHKESHVLDIARNVAWTGLDQQAVTAYSKCLDNQVFKLDGLHAAVVAATQSDITILVKWFVPHRGEPAIVAWHPRAIKGETIQKEIPQGSTSVRVMRPDKQLALSGNYPGWTTGAIVLEPLSQTKAVEQRKTTTTLCLQANYFERIKVMAGETIRISAGISPNCGSKGWTIDDWITSSGPDGALYKDAPYFSPSALLPGQKLGTIIGAYSATEVGTDAGAYRAVWNVVHDSGPFAIGYSYTGKAPKSGYLYMIINDVPFAEADNKGAVSVQVTPEP